MADNPTTLIPDDTDKLPEVTTFHVTRKPDGWWTITARRHHAGLYMVGRDLAALMHEAPSVLNHLLKLDGACPAPEFLKESR